VPLRLLTGFVADPDLLASGLNFALTYLAHSLVWTIVAALLARVRGLPSATRHSCWKVALFAPLFTAALAWVATASCARSAGRTAHSLPAFTVAQPLSSSGYRRGRALGAFCLAASLLGGARFSGMLYQVRRRLRRRSALADPALFARVERLRTQMGLPRITLSESDDVRSPLVIGCAEVCLPSASLAVLGDADLDAVLAHELAHIERGDGLWFPIAAAVHSVLWLNPLNYCIVRGFRTSAEVACDDRAVELTGDRLGLARALLNLASAAAFAQRLSLMPTIAHSQSALSMRVRRLLSGSADAAPGAGRRARLSAILALTALATPLAALGIQVVQEQPKASTGLGSRGLADASDLAGVTVPDLDAQSQRRAQLAQRGQRVAALLRAAEQQSTTDQEGSSAATRVLELGQELRHIRATQLWLEEQSVSAAR